MAVAGDGFYLAERVRRLCTEQPHGAAPWMGSEIHAALEAASRHSGDHQRFYLTFLEGLREILDEDGDALLTRFARQAADSEARVLADDLTYRDHLTHVTQVYLLGWLVLNECRKFSSLGDEWQPYGWPAEDRFERLNHAWVYTALLHDCAYSVDHAKSARAHEVRVRAMFGPVYQPAVAGRIDAAACWRTGEPLWKRRARIIERPLSRAVRRELESYHTRPDHAFVAAQALMAEAGQHVAPQRELLEVAATSLACHNFRHRLDPHIEPAEEIIDWFAVDFWHEPLAALLTVTDEIQEWGRERLDLAVAREQARSEDPFERVVLTHLALSDAAGLSIDVRLLFHVLPEDRSRRQRMATNRERANAKASRMYRNALRLRLGAPATLDLHLRIEETVEDVPCRMGRRFGWREVARWPLRQRATEVVRPEGHDAGLQPVRAAVANEGNELALELRADGTGAITGGTPPEGGLRVAVVGPGGCGKSTMLRGLGASRRVARRRLVPLYVEELEDDLVDLGEECEALHREADDADVLLLVDHLDRLVGTAVEAFWLDQLQSLPAHPWLHVVAACRPEEYTAVVGLTLETPAAGRQAFQRTTIEQPAGLLMSGTDEENRATARSIERHLSRGRAAFEVLGDVALAMGSRRSREGPPVDIGTAVTFGGRPAVALEGDRVRFVHDAVQDYFSAWSLARGLAEPSGKRSAAGQLAALRELPRDVLRLLLDLLTHSRVMDESSTATDADLVDTNPPPSRGGPIEARMARRSSTRRWTESAPIEGRPH